MDQQAQLEDQVVVRSEEENSRYNIDTECRAPEPCQDFQTTRLILSHLGLLNVHSLRECSDSPVPRLVTLDSESSGFVNDLEALDRISPKTFDTVHIFYGKSGQRQREEILQNVVSYKATKTKLIRILKDYSFSIRPKTPTPTFWNF